MDINQFIHSLAWFFEKFGYYVVFLSGLIEITPLGWALPGGLILAVAGFFANTQQDLSLVGLILAGSFGSWISLCLAYLLGKKSGMWLVAKLHQEKNASFAKQLLKKNGGVILTTSMMANLTRFWVAYIAGVDGYNFSKFLNYSGLASISWVSLVTILGYLAGFERYNIEKILGSIGIIGWLFFGLAIFVVGKSIKHEYQHFKEDSPHQDESR